MTDPRVLRLADLLVNYSTSVQPGHKVVIFGEPLAAPLISAVYERVLLAGGHPVLNLSLPGLYEVYYRLANDDQLQFISPASRIYYEEFDAMIHVGGTANSRELSGIDPARQGLRRRATTALSEMHMRRTADGSMQWVVAEYPTDSSAQDAEMSLREYENFVYGACHVDDPNVDPVAHWRQVHDEQQRLVDWLKPHDQVIVRGPNADLTLSIKDRIFKNADGVRNMPDGEIFTGPVEDSVNGWVNFTYPVVAFGREIDGVRLEFDEGKVVSASATKNEQFLLSALDTDEGARYVGEFAIGTNFGITRFTRSILFDEKIGGSFHMALGAGYPETGSKNKSGLHWDMICDMRDGGEIWVDGELFYHNGEFKV
jgi:aminopeptidase